MDTTVRDQGSTRFRSVRRRRTRPRSAGAPRLDSVVAAAAVRPVERTPGERMRRATVLGGLIGLLLMGAAIYFMSLAAGANSAGALGVAAFCAVWGGVGFGCMFGAICSAAWEERREAHARRAGASRGPR